MESQLQGPAAVSETTSEASAPLPKARMIAPVSSTGKSRIAVDAKADTDTISPQRKRRRSISWIRLMRKVPPILGVRRQAGAK